MMREPDEILTAILGSSPVGATITERATGLRLYANAAFAKTMGAMGPEDLIGSSVSETWVRLEDYQKFATALSGDQPQADFEAP